MYYPWWGDSRLGMEGKLIFSYHKLGYILQGGLSVPSIARDLATTLLPLGAATRADPMGMLQGVSTDHWDPPPAKIPLDLFLIFPGPLLLPARCEHQTPNTITAQQALMLSESSMENQAGLLGKSGDSVWYSVRERGRGDGRWGHSCRPQHSDREWSSIQREKHQEQILCWKRGWEDWKLQGHRAGSHCNLCIALALDFPFTGEGLLC